MKAVGIIVEYNPFHNGHKYHLEEAKKLGDVVIAVMSGDFTQRGEPSIIDRYSKTQMALDNGVDIVVELPSFYSCQSAEIFARGGIGILNELKVDKIIFGSESNDLKKLEEIVSFQESDEFKEILKNYLNLGNSYPTAHSLTMNEILGDYKIESNDILGLEYLKSIKYFGNNIKPYLLKRKNISYYDENTKDNFASATKIRYNINENIKYYEFVPKESYEILKNYKKFVKLSDFYPYLRYEFIKNYKNLENIQDMEIGFNNRLYKYAEKFLNFDDFMNSISNKRYTQGRIQRVLLHSMLNLTKDITEYVKNNVPYVKIMGFNKKGREYLNYLKKFENKKILTSYKNMNKILDKKACSLIEFNEKCSKIYKLINDYDDKKKIITKF